MKRHSIGQHNIYIFESPERLKAAASEHMISTCAARAQEAETVSIALSGGSTPVGVYKNLVDDEFILSQSESLPPFPWQKSLFFFGDERYVPQDDDQSNYQMACEAFLNAAPLDKRQIFPIPTQCDEAEVCAQQYAEQLTMLPQHQGVPVFDYVLLGIGDDGHTASLFPGTPILNEIKQSVASVYVEKFNSWRISLTFPVLNQARVCSVLVAGEAKASVLAEVIQNKHNPYPIGKINNPNGLHWFVDQAAASQLN